MRERMTVEQECLRSIAYAMMSYLYNLDAPDWLRVQAAFFYLVYGGDYGFSRF